MAETATTEPVAPAKSPRTRSPNYPAFTLEEALNKADQLYEANDQHFAQWEAAAQHLGYSAKSSSFGKAIGALAQFGLIEDQGAGDKRQIKVSSRYLDINPKTGTPEKRHKALADAALAPKLHSELWEKYDHRLPPADDSIRYYLLRERKDGNFNRATVDGFIDQLRTTLKFGGLLGDDKNGADKSGDTSKNGTDLEGQQKLVRVGSFVQWTSNGQHQFQVPQRVAGVDGDWAFVEDSPTGLPMSELSVVDPPANTAPKQPPVNPFYRPPAPDDDEPTEGVALDRTTLDEGPVRLEWPDELSEDSVEEFQYWIVGRINRARRKAGLSKISISEEEAGE